MQRKAAGTALAAAGGVVFLVSGALGCAKTVAASNAAATRWSSTLFIQANTTLKR